MKDTIGPLDQDALQYGSMMPEGWQAEIELTTDRDERESANDQAQAQPPTATPERKGDNQ